MRNCISKRTNVCMKLVLQRRHETESRRSSSLNLAQKRIPKKPLEEERGQVLRKEQKVLRRGGKYWGSGGRESREEWCTKELSIFGLQSAQSTRSVIISKFLVPINKNRKSQSFWFTVETVYSTNCACLATCKQAKVCRGKKKQQKRGRWRGAVPSLSFYGKD